MAAWLRMGHGGSPPQIEVLWVTTLVGRIVKPLCALRDERGARVRNLYPQPVDSIVPSQSDVTQEFRRLSPALSPATHRRDGVSAQAIHSCPQPLWTTGFPGSARTASVALSVATPNVLCE